MPWVHFHRPFDYRIAPRAITHCEPGRALVKLEVAEAAVAAGAGVIIERPADEPVTMPRKIRNRRRGK